MALYKYAHHFQRTDSAEFDRLFHPGDSCPHSGSYRCITCGAEAACNYGDPLPPQNHHQHSPLAGRITWQMITWA